MWNFLSLGNISGVIFNAEISENKAGWIKYDVSLNPAGDLLIHCTIPLSGPFVWTHANETLAENNDFMRNDQ